MQAGELTGKYIICSCEGVAEETIIDILLDNDRLCFKRDDLIGKKSTRIREGKNIAREYLCRAYEREIVILRILDRETEKFSLPKIYEERKNISVINIVTKPEIEILHIIADGLMDEFKNQKKLKASEYYKSCLSKQGVHCHVKSEAFVRAKYADDVEKLIAAIEEQSRVIEQKAPHLWDLIK